MHLQLLITPRFDDAWNVPDIESIMRLTLSLNDIELIAIFQLRKKAETKYRDGKVILDRLCEILSRAAHDIRDICDISLD